MLIHEFVIASRKEIMCNIENCMKEYNLKIVSNFIKEGKECILVDDDIILDNHIDFLGEFKSHWCCIGNIEKGLNYYGITIILNEDLISFIDVLNKYKHEQCIRALIRMCENAMVQNMDLIHFGI